MAQTLTYCTTKLFSQAILPLVMIKPWPFVNANDDDPLAPFPSVWRQAVALSRTNSSSGNLAGSK